MRPHCLKRRRRHSALETGKTVATRAFVRVCKIYRRGYCDRGKCAPRIQTSGEGVGQPPTAGFATRSCRWCPTAVPHGTEDPGRWPKRAGGKLRRIPRCDEVPVRHQQTTVVRTGRRESLRRRDTRLQLPTYLPVKLTPEKKKRGAGEKRGARKARRLKQSSATTSGFLSCVASRPESVAGGWGRIERPALSGDPFRL